MVNLLGLKYSFRIEAQVACICLQLSKYYMFLLNKLPCTDREFNEVPSPFETFNLAKLCSRTKTAKLVAKFFPIR